MQRFQFKPQYTGPGVQDAKVGSISIEEIQNMTMPEFLKFEGQLVNVRRRKRRDQAVWRSNTAITTAMSKDIFRNGIGAVDAFADDPNTTYNKTRAHTNMSMNGSFGEGSLTIVTALEAYHANFALRGTTYTGGQITNPLGVAVTGFDPGLLTHTVCRQFEVAFYKGETRIIDGLVEEFPQMNAISGVAGAAVGALFQNAALPGNYLNNPVVLKDDADFHVNVAPLTALDLSTASGLTLVGVTIMIKLNTIELRNVEA